MIRFTVAVCTRNRANPLAAALSSLRAARSPGVDWEVLVVLNDCTDNSAEVVRDAAPGLPLRVAAEPRAGASHARNRAVEAARGEYLIFIDDDVRVGPEFLAAYAESFRRWPEADLFGGPITPAFEDGPPAWVSESLEVIGNVYARRVAQEDGAPILENYQPFGANYALRMSRQRQHPYDPSLGPAPVGWVRLGEETEVIEAALAAGASGRWVAGATVEHVMPKERQTVRYIWRYYQGLGRLRVQLGRPGYSLLPARLAYALLRYRWNRLVAPPQEWTKSLITAARLSGMLKARLAGGRAAAAKQAV